MSLVPPTSRPFNPVGWTSDANGNVVGAPNGSLAFDDGTSNTSIAASGVGVFADTGDEGYEMSFGTGIASFGADDTTSVIKGLPATDPGNAGEYYSVAGIIHASAG